MCYDRNPPPPPPKVINYTKLFTARFFFSQLVVCVDVVRASVTPWHQVFGVKVWMSHRQLAATMRLCLAASAVRLHRDAPSFLSSIISALPRQHSQCFFVFFWCVCLGGNVSYRMMFKYFKETDCFSFKKTECFPFFVYVCMYHCMFCYVCVWGGGLQILIVFRYLSRQFSFVFVCVCAVLLYYHMLCLSGGEGWGFSFILLLQHPVGEREKEGEAEEGEIPWSPEAFVMCLPCREQEEELNHHLTDNGDHLFSSLENIMLPCEFCNELLPADSLVQHQVSVRIDFSTFNAWERSC